MIILLGLLFSAFSYLVLLAMSNCDEMTAAEINRDLAE